MCCIKSAENWVDYVTGNVRGTTTPCAAKKACDDWNDKPEADRTWINMQQHFREWYDKKMTEATTEVAGYHGANLASSDLHLSRADLLLADTTETLKNNQAMMANLAKKNDEKDDTIDH